MGEFEDALAATEADALATVKAAEGAVRNLKKLVTAARTGDVAALERGLDDAESAIQALREQFRNTHEGWTFPTQTYAEAGELTRELLSMAEAAGLPVHEQDGRIFSYPVLVRVLPGERAILLDKAKSRQIRPSVVVALLDRLRKRPARFRPESFVSTLHEVYEVRLRMDGSRQRYLDGNGPPVQLIRLYELLTLFPGQEKEYSKADFTRDLYLIDRSGTSVSRDGRVEMSFHASTGTRLNPLQIVDEGGHQRDYYAVSFRWRDQ